MQNNRAQFFTLLLFLSVLLLTLSNGFLPRILAEEKQVDVFQSIQPIGDVLDEVLRSYVSEPEMDKVVEGALEGMMGSLDAHSSYIPRKAHEFMQEDTEGEFTGIGVVIHLDEDKNIAVHQPFPGGPAARAGVVTGDIIAKINDTVTKGITLDEARDLIRGPKGSNIRLTVVRRFPDSPDAEIQVLEFDVKRGTIPLQSIDEARVLDGGVGYVRVSDFKKSTGDELAGKIEEMKTDGLKSLVLDLRWNPGGLLPSSKDVCELFLPKGSLVTYTKGRNGETDSSSLSGSLRLYTEKEPILPPAVPMVVLVNEASASASEIVTGALQYWSRALIVGVKTYGKGSVQTIIPLRRPEGAAIRLTTALYYTPAEVTIHERGILPDLEAPFPKESWLKLWQQMMASYMKDASKQNQQNHGAITGDPVTPETVEDAQLVKAVEILKANPTTSQLMSMHKDTNETQITALTAENGGVAAKEPKDKIFTIGGNVVDMSGPETHITPAPSDAAKPASDGVPIPAPAPDGAARPAAGEQK